MDIANALRQQGGAARRAELIRMGVTRRAFESACARGAIVTSLGIWHFPGVDPAVVAAAAFGASVTCVTAFTAAGLPTLVRDSRIHLHLPNNRGVHGTAGRPLRNIVLHRSDQTPALATAIDLAWRCTEPLGQLVMLNGALARSLIRPDEVWNFTATPMERRLWLRKQCSPLAKSMLETVAGWHLSNAGIPFQRQVLIEAVGHVDMLIGKLVVEADGKQFHWNAAAFEEDRRRDRELALRGYERLRFTFNDVMSRPKAFVADVQAMLALMSTFAR